MNFEGTRDTARVLCVAIQKRRGAKAFFAKGPSRSSVMRSGPPLSRIKSLGSWVSAFCWRAGGFAGREMETGQ